MKPIQELTKEEFEKIPSRKWNEDIGEFDSLVILPTEQIHDSGYACMDFVAVRKGKPFCRLSGCSDVIHIDGIGGLGRDFLSNTLTAWSIDCLPESKLLQIFCQSRKLIAGSALSSFEVFAR